jgi:hypothetical protein
MVVGDEERAHQVRRLGELGDPGLDQRGDLLEPAQLTQARVVGQHAVGDEEGQQPAGEVTDLSSRM